jgi:hypothetical protein
MNKEKKTYERVGSIWECQANGCPHHGHCGGCSLGKVSLTCDDNLCENNVEIREGVYGCKSMDIHLDANGNCLLKKEKISER